MYWIDAWLITAGTNAGVVKEVGEALSNYRYKNKKHGLDVPCIGIASWGYTAGNEKLVTQSTNHCINTTSTRGTRLFTRSTQNQTINAASMVSWIICLIKKQNTLLFVKLNLGHRWSILCSKLCC